MNLPKKDRLVLAAKWGTVLLGELAVVAPFIVASTVLTDERAEAVLALQNKLRQRALVWMFPDVVLRRGGASEPQ